MVSTQASHLPKSSQTSNRQPQQTSSPPYLWLSVPRPELAAASFGFTWELPSQVAAICRLLCSLCWVAQGRTQVGADPGLYHLGNSRACTPSGQLLTMSEHHHPAPARLILYRGWRFVASGHSQSLQLTGLGKSLPLTCQQQSKLNYKRRVFSAQMEDTPRVPNLVIREVMPLDPTRHLLH